ncbi:MAG: MFS transporter [Anaerolineae bacterium]|nr:MFS transporter [Anaerolineae bacterium]
MSKSDSPYHAGRHRSGRLRLRLRYLGRQLSSFTAGGRWTDRLSPTVRRNLRWFWFDGILAQASESIVVAYLSLFILALGASRAQIGLMSSLSSLSGALLLLPGAALVERLGRRKCIAVLSGGGIARLTLLLLALTPLLPAGAPLVYIAIALAVIRSAFGNLGHPAWMSLTADIVPINWRGRYFASRNIAMGVTGMVITYLMGELITRMGSPVGYQWALGIAFAVGMLSTFCFARIEEGNPAPYRVMSTRQAPLSILSRHPDFLVLCAVAALWNFSLNIAAPFFNVYLVEDLRATASIVGVMSVISSLAGLPGQRLFGVLADRWGPRRVQMLTGVCIPLIPLAWSLIRAPWQAAPLNLAGGFLWAGYNLASFNFLLALIPEERRPHYSALYQIVVMVALTGGAALGGFIAEQWGYKSAFVVSGLGRLTAALFFARFVRQPRESEDRAVSPEAT